MGRKSQNSSNSSKPKSSNKKPKPAKEEKELLETVDCLLRLTTLPIHNNIAQSLECQKQISSFIDRIKVLEEKLTKKQSKVSFLWS